MKTITLKSVMAVLVALFSLNANAYDVEIDGIYYNLITKVKTAKVTNPYDNMMDKALNSVYSGKISIPATIEYNGVEYTVVAIEAYAFQFNHVTSISLPNTITSIGVGAFESSSIKSIEFPNSVTTIGKMAFEHCSLLESVTFPNSLYTIGEYTFSGCRKLKEVFFSNSISSIQNGAFEDCENLTAIDIPNSVVSIGNSAFYGCINLEQVIFHDATLQSIGYSAFCGCKKLSSINIPNSVGYIGGQSFADCTSITSFEIPNSVGGIEYGTFQGCSHLESVIIPRSVTSIGGSAFADCVNLTDIYCYAPQPPTIPETDKFLISYRLPFDNAFPEYITLHIPISSLNKYKSTEPWDVFGTYETLPPGIFTLTYIVDGEEYNTLEVEEGASIPKLAEPTKEGYTFSGWSEIPETMPAEDITVTGSFIINKYTLTYIVDGEIYKTYEVEYGANITPEADPEKEGYTFDGWNEIPATMPANDVTITGSFTAVVVLDTGKTYSFQSKQNDYYMTLSADGVSLTAEPYGLKLEKTDGGQYYITDGEYYVGLAGTDNWSMTSAPDKKEPLGLSSTTIDGQVYYSFNESLGMVGVDWPKKNNMGCWADKKTSDGDAVLWLVKEMEVVDAIADVKATEGDYQIYTIDGKAISTLQKGVNIIRYSNGKVKKVLVN
jgi:uncharacterized repeat protein (TIGR02543 family)